MKRAGQLIEKIADIDNLLLAYRKARRGKQHKKSVREYSENLFSNIALLRSNILSGSVDVGNYHYFKIFDPKERLISAATFSERVLHHAIMNVCQPVFERHLIYDTYATREGKGIYKAIDKARLAMRKYNYVAKLDVRKYFDSISHKILKVKLRGLFKDTKLIEILEMIIDSYCAHTQKGIPIGNLTSQYFANYYLSHLDHYIKENLKTPVYIRYMDDMLLFADTKKMLDEYVSKVENYLQEKVHLQLKPVVKQSTCYGISFLGYKLYKNKILLNGRSKKRLKSKIFQYESNRINGNWSEVAYIQHITPLLAYAQKAYSKSLIRSLLV